jgi:large subunit ribosomal protein L21
LTNEEGTTVSFDKVYLLDDNGVITIGAHIEGASVEAKVLQHLKEIKLSFSKRKKDTKEKWSQQFLTQIVIEGITAAGAKKRLLRKGGSS